MLQQIRAGQRLSDRTVDESAAQALALERALWAEPEPALENGTLGQQPPPPAPTPALPEGPCPEAFLRDLIDPNTGILRSCVTPNPLPGGDRGFGGWVSVPVALERAHRDAAAASAGSTARWASLASSARSHSKQRLVLPRLSRPTPEEMFELAAHVGAGAPLH